VPVATLAAPWAPQKAANSRQMLKLPAKNVAAAIEHLFKGTHQFLFDLARLLAEGSCTAL